MGDISVIHLDDSTGYRVHKDGFLAGSNHLKISTRLQNLTGGLFSGEGFFILKIHGNGILFINSFGAIHEIDLSEEEEIVVDNKHLAAWPETVKYRVEMAAGWVSSMTSGEVLACRFQGPGKIFIQTRNPRAFGEWSKRFIHFDRNKR